MKRALILSLIAIGLTAMGTAQAQAMCMPHEHVVAKLQQHHGESVRGLGLGDRGHTVLELFVSESGSWTILMTRTTGVTCIMATGQSWTNFPMAVSAEEEPT